MSNLKLTKFQQDVESPIFIRKEYLNGRCAALGLPRDLLSVIQEDVDFDAESEQILERVKDTNRNRFFEYRENQFVEVNNPKWFRQI